MAWALGKCQAPRGRGKVGSWSGGNPCSSQISLGEPGLGRATAGQRLLVLELWVSVGPAWCISREEGQGKVQPWLFYLATGLLLPRLLLSISFPETGKRFHRACVGAWWGNNLGHRIGQRPPRGGFDELPGAECDLPALEHHPPSSHCLGAGRGAGDPQSHHPTRGTLPLLSLSLWAQKHWAEQGAELPAPSPATRQDRRENGKMPRRG